ncbi:hypothetical protein V6Z11_D13G107700 [Gossypium hirsutum]
MQPQQPVPSPLLTPRTSKNADGAPLLVPLARGRVQKLLNVGGYRDVGAATWGRWWHLDYSAANLLLTVA